MNAPVTIPTSTRDIALPDLSTLPPRLAAKLGRMDPERLTSIFTEPEGTTK